MDFSTLLRDLQPVVTGWVVNLLQHGAGVGMHIGSAVTDPAPGCLELDGSIRSSTPLGCQVYHDSDQTLPSGIWTAAAFNRSQFDTDAMHELASNTPRVTCRSGGVYLFSGRLLFSANASGIRGTALRLNGSTILAQNGPFTATANDFGLSVTGVYWMDAGDYVELLGFQSSGGNLAVRSVSRCSPGLAAVRLA